jgi:hypothetical protein
MLLYYILLTLDIKGFLGAIPPYFFSAHAYKQNGSSQHKLVPKPAPNTPNYESALPKRKKNSRF